MGRNSPGLLLKQILLAMLLVLSVYSAKATHIVGVELYYECINPFDHTYRITLVMYRDCLEGQAEFDDELNLFIFPSLQANNWWIETIQRPPLFPEIVPDGWDTCIGQPYNLCVEIGVYQKDIKLPPIVGGYDLAWARCCRNAAITNLLNPLNQGATFHIHVPDKDDANCNSSPVFKQRLPVFICVGETFYFDHSANDPDGDSLVYKMGTPYTGVNFFGWGAGNNQNGNPPPIVDLTNPMGPPPYQSVNYSSFQYTPTQPFGPNSTSIDPQTGFLTISPPQIGIFVIAVSVLEYRNGVLLSENKVDLQVHVMKCKEQGPPPWIEHDLSVVDSLNPGLSLAYGSNDTIYAVAGTPFCYQVTVEDSVPTDTVFAFAVNQTQFTPNFTITKIDTGINPITFEVCWTPNCNVVGQTIPLIIGGRDKFDCVNHNYVYDTVYITIQPPPQVAPLVNYDTTSANFVNDTIILNVDSTTCFEWWVTDTVATGQLGWNLIIQEIGGNGSITPVTTVGKFADSLALVTCWTATCDAMGKTYRLILEGNDNSECPPDAEDRDTLYIRVNLLSNPPPVMSHDLSGNVFSNDTITIDVHDTLCYSFTVKDTYPAVNLNYVFTIENVDGSGYAGPLPTQNILTQNDSIVVEICWEPNCDNINATFLLRAVGTQENLCQQFAEAFDSVYVVVNEIFNPPPILTHTFLPGFTVDGDTIHIAADSTVCYEFELRDTVWRSHLEIDWEAQLMPAGGNSGHTLEITFSDSTDTLIRGTLCFYPGCDYADERIRIATSGKDTLDCNATNWVYDTVYIDVHAPVNQPPVITHDLTGLTLDADSAVLVIPNGETFCYQVTLSDPDSLWADLTAEGANEIFDFSWRNGNPAAITLTGTNPLNVEVCWNPSCYEANQEFILEVCGRDTSRCALTPTVCDEVVFRIDSCTIEFANVFTPNGDGINDEFLPFDMKGVEFFELKVYDRWGKPVFRNANTAWNGNINNGSTEASAGVYFWTIAYRYWSAEGIPLQARARGNVTLIR